MGLENCCLLHPHLICTSGHTTFAAGPVSALNIIVRRVGLLVTSRSPRTFNLRCQTPNIVRPIVTRPFACCILMNYSTRKRVRVRRSHGVPLLELHRDECYTQLTTRQGLRQRLPATRKYPPCSQDCRRVRTRLDAPASLSYIDAHLQRAIQHRVCHYFMCDIHPQGRICA